MDHVNLKEWAESRGVAYVTARRWYAAGKLPVPARKVGGLILVGEPVTHHATSLWCTRGCRPTTKSPILTGRLPGSLRGLASRAFRLAVS